MPREEEVKEKKTPPSLVRREKKTPPSLGMGMGLGLSSYQIEDPTPSWTESTSLLTAAKTIEILGATPELRFTESDQADPVGRFRWQGSGGSYLLYKALTANWATQEVILQHNITSKFTSLTAITTADWYLRLDGGNILTTGGFIQIGANNGIELRTGNGVASAIARMILRGNAATPDIDIDQANLDLNGYGVYGVGAIRGQGTQALYLRGWRETTDTVGRRVIVDVLDVATDTVYQVAAAVPNGATPFMTTVAPDATPTTAHLDADHITFSYTKATDTLNVFVNEGGVIRTLAIGVLA